MASVRQRPDGRWLARYRDGAGREHIKTFPRKGAANRRLNEQTAGLVRGDWINPKDGRVTFRGYADGWRARQRHREGTATSVEQQLRLHVLPVIGDLPLRAICPSDIDTLIVGLSDRLAPGTVGVIYGRVAAVFNDAVRDKVIAATPCVNVKRPRTTPSSTLQVLTTEQVTTMADTIPARYRALVITVLAPDSDPANYSG